MQLTKEEAEEYLENRRQKGFNAILVNLIEYNYADNPPKNKYGDAPFTTPGDFSTPNEAYFAHADWVIQKAREKGILVVLNPCYTGTGADNKDGWRKADRGERADEMPRLRAVRGQPLQGLYQHHLAGGGRHDAPRRDQSVEKNWLEILQGIKDHAPDHLWSAHFSVHHGPGSEHFAPYMSMDNAYGGNRSYIHTLRAYNRANPKPTFYNEGYYEDTHLGQVGAASRSAACAGLLGHPFGGDRSYFWERPCLGVRQSASTSNRNCG